MGASANGWRLNIDTADAVDQRRFNFFGKQTFEATANVRLVRAVRAHELLAHSKVLGSRLRARRRASAIGTSERFARGRPRESVPRARVSHE